MSEWGCRLIWHLPPPGNVAIVGLYPAFCWTHCSFHCVLNISPQNCMFAFAGVKAASTSTNAFAHMLECCPGNVCGCGSLPEGACIPQKLAWLCNALCAAICSVRVCDAVKQSVQITAHFSSFTTSILPNIVHPKGCAYQWCQAFGSH